MLHLVGIYAFDTISIYNIIIIMFSLAVDNQISCVENTTAGLYGHYTVRDFTVA